MIYSVTKVNGEMVVTPSREGRYRARTSGEIKRALSEPNFKTTTAEVRIGKNWRPLKRAYVPERLIPAEPKPLSRKLRILKAFHLYNPLEALIYK